MALLPPTKLMVEGVKLHNHEVGMFVERFVKLIVCPTVGLVMSAIKSATGGALGGAYISDSHKPLPEVAARILLKPGFPVL